MIVTAFVWFANQDRKLGRTLVEHLREIDIKILNLRTRDDIEWLVADDSTDYWIERADVIVALLSKSFLDEFKGTETWSRAFERRQHNQVIIVPVLIGQVPINERFIGAFAPMTMLPRDGIPMCEREHADSEWTEVARQINQAGKQRLHFTPPEPSAPPPPVAHAPPPLTPGALAELFERLSVLQAQEDDMHQQVRELQELIYKEGRFASGDVIGRRFRLLAREGSDDWLQRWHGWDNHTKRSVTIHLLNRALAQNESMRDDLFRRAERMKRSSHPALSRVVHAGPSDGLHIIVSDHQDGRNLRDVVLRQNLPNHAVIGLIFRLGQGLARLHDQGLIHGNVQPSSVVWDEDVGAYLEGWDPLIGLQLLDRSFIRATPYLAPELRGRSDQRERATRQSDLFGLAMLAVFALYGADLGPFAVSHIEGVLCNLPCDDQVRKVLAKATATEPSLRHRSVREFCESLVAAQRAAQPLSEMIEIPGGTFTMGAAGDDADAKPFERPAHEVTLDAFLIARHPVTQRLYEEVMTINPSAGRLHEALPVSRVSFLDAIELCNRLSALDGFTPAYSLMDNAIFWDQNADGYRLPTEAEWEYAARGVDGRLFPWGNTAPSDQLAWNGSGNELGQGNRKGPALVGTHPSGASPFGVEDMTGNVWEWCWDYRGPYPLEPVKNPIGPETSTPPDVLKTEVAPPGRVYRIMRGGAWNIQDWVWLRASTRITDDETVRDPDVGFRLARNAPRSK